MFRFEKLEVWKLANEYCLKIYGITDTFPKHEMFCLTSQLNRAGISISSNIAEGSGASSEKDFSRFLDIAIKSTIETVSQLFIAEQRLYITGDTKNSLYIDAEILVKKIQSLKQYLKRPRATTYHPQSNKETPYDTV